jgi:hypothetical protein
MPIITSARDHLLTARAQEKKPFKSLDWSALVSGNRVAAGLDAFDHRKHVSLWRWWFNRVLELIGFSGG